MIYLPAIG